MLCQKCNERNASIHITKIVNGEKQELHLCEECSNLHNKFKNNFNFSNFISSMLNLEEGTDHIEHFYPGDAKCDACGMDYDSFKRHGKFGCDKCYFAFRNNISPIIKKLHGKEQHTGKIVQYGGESLRLDREISELNAKLAAAVELEEYEKAAEYRDKIKKLREDSYKNI